MNISSIYTSPKFHSFISNMFLESSACMDIPSSDGRLLVWTNPQHDASLDGWWTDRPSETNYSPTTLLCRGIIIMLWWISGKTNATRTTRMPAFWGLMITHTIESYWIPSQKNYRSRTENVTERIRFSKSRSNDLADIGQGQRSSHATHLLMLVIICTKYGKNPPRAVDATKRTRFPRSRPNDLENIGQRSLHATHPLMLMMICAKYGKNASRIVDFFFSRWNFKILL